MENFVNLDLKVVVASQCQLFSLPRIQEAVQVNRGRIVGVEPELNAISLNRSIRRNQANILILTIDNEKMICSLISDVKRAHPSLNIITIALKLKQIPMLIKTGKVKAIIFANEENDQLIQAIRRTNFNKSHYSPKASEIMARQIARPRLTPREQEVLDLLDEKKTRSQIASLLEISIVTVNSHVRNIRDKGVYFPN